MDRALVSGTRCAGSIPVGDIINIRHLVLVSLSVLNLIILCPPYLRTILILPLVVGIYMAQAYVSHWAFIDIDQVDFPQLRAVDAKILGISNIATSLSLAFTS